MTDLEFFKTIFDKAGIEYDLEHGKELDQDEPEDGVIQLTTREEEHKNVLGYYGFYSVHFFDRLGNLLNIGAWE